LGSSVICTLAGGITMNNGKNITFTGSTSGTVSLAAAGTTTNYSLALPDAQGAGVLTNDESGNLSWAVTNRITTNTTP